MTGKVGIRKNTGIICGVGVNDTGSIDSPLYVAWRSMIDRCYAAETRKRTCYAGCSVCEEWLLFSRFEEWALTQPWEGNCLDKDLLVRGNTIYGPDRCVFLPVQLNSFVSSVKASKSNLPPGVSIRPCNGSFKAQCSNPFTRKHENLGYFKTKEQAHRAWRLRKSEHAAVYASEQQDPRVSLALLNLFVEDEQ